MGENAALEEPANVELAKREGEVDAAQEDKDRMFRRASTDLADYDIEVEYDSDAEREAILETARQEAEKQRIAAARAEQERLEAEQVQILELRAEEEAFRTQQEEFERVAKLD